MDSINHGDFPCAFLSETKNISHGRFRKLRICGFAWKIWSFKWGVFLVQVRCIGVGCPGCQSDTYRFKFFGGWSRVPEKNLHVPSRSASGDTDTPRWINIEAEKNRPLKQKITFHTFIFIGSMWIWWGLHPLWVCQELVAPQIHWVSYMLYLPTFIIKIEQM